MIIYYTDRYRGGRAESRRLLEKALSEYMGDPGRAKALISETKTGEKGKPYIEGAAPFSVSHTGNIWAVLFADTDCGLDIQFEKSCDAVSIARRFYAPEDAALVASADESEAKALFFRLWTRREALAKAMGGSVYDSELPAVSAEHVNAGGAVYTISDISIPGLQDIHAAVCTEGAPGNMVFAELL